MNSYPSNFDPANFLGVDRFEHINGDDDTWVMWCAGNEKFFEESFASFCFWHFCDAIEVFVLWEKDKKWPQEYWGCDELAIQRFRNDLIPFFDFVSRQKEEAWLTHPLEIVSKLTKIDRSGNTRKFNVQALCAYSIKCLDDGVSGLKDGDVGKASAAFAYSVTSLNLAREYRAEQAISTDRVNLEEAAALSRLGQIGAAAKHAQDPRQFDKTFVKECWENWQMKPETYKTKADFARDMLEKCEHLRSQKSIEDWCRVWENEKNNISLRA